MVLDASAYSLSFSSLAFLAALVVCWLCASFSFLKEELVKAKLT